MSQGTSKLMLLQLGRGLGVVDDAERDRQPERGSDHDRGERDERRFEQEAELDHAALEPDRAEDADLLSALDDRAGGDHAERGDAGDQPEPHEAFDQPVEGQVCGDGVVEQLLQRVGLHAVGEERRLEALLRSPSASVPGASEIR